MLVDFSFENFLSFRDEASISLVASDHVDKREPKSDISGRPVDDDSISYDRLIPVPGRDEHVVKIAAVYGANGSGKSNLVEALIFFKVLVTTSVDDDTLLSRFQPRTYQFDTSTVSGTSSFEITFITGGVKYRYGFEVDTLSVISEWLYMLPEGESEEVECFSREGSEIEMSHQYFSDDEKLKGKTRSNALFLTVCAQWNVGVAMTVRDWVRIRVNILSGLSDDTTSYTINECMNHPETHKKMLEFFNTLALGIDDIEYEEVEIPIPMMEPTVFRNNLAHGRMSPSVGEELGREVAKQKHTNVWTIHTLYDGDEVSGKIRMPFRLESVGTKRLFALMGPLFDIMENGGVAVIDEFGSSIHTQMLVELVKVFQSRINTRGQMIAITHDTNLLRKDLLRRDQIWFVEKDPEGASHLYSLLEFVNNPECGTGDYRTDYLRGIYGAIPYFGDLKRFEEEYTVGQGK